MRDDVRTAIKGLDPKARREYLVDHGLCPICGEEAAPWYLCPHHRLVGSIRRLLNKAANHHILEKTRDSRGNLWKAHSDFKGDADAVHKAWDAVRWGTYGPDMKEGDKRLRPRLGRRPVDLDETLTSIFANAHRPLSLDEVTQAWGKLRSKRKTGTLSGDMTKLIRAQRRREDRNAKRIASEAI